MTCHSLLCTKVMSPWNFFSGTQTLTPWADIAVPRAGVVDREATATSMSATTTAAAIVRFALSVTMRLPFLQVRGMSHPYRELNRMKDSWSSSCFASKA